jgi:leader peptidase (prepilin peptidase) / N-methyltransferase
MRFSFDIFVHDFYFSAAGAWLLTGLMFALGAAVGSFLNVVAYRLPRKLSLSRPGSQCPACGHPIRWYDNVPIFAWLVLRGRCRDCRAPISPRYPLVELLVALATALVTRSAFGPIFETEPGDAFTLDVPRLAFRLALVYTLFCAALLEFDGHRAPVRLLIAVLAVGAILVIVLPELGSSPSVDKSAGRGVYECLGGLAAALLFGLLAWPALAEKGQDGLLRNAAARVGNLAIVGVFLGLPAVTEIAVFAISWLLATRILGRVWTTAARFGWAGSLVLGTLIWIVAGGKIAERWPSIADDPATTLVMAGAVVAAVAIAARVAGSGTPTGTASAGEQR